MEQDHWLHGFNYNVEEWDEDGLHYETLAICRQLADARAVFKEAVAEKPSGRLMIRSRTRVVKRHLEGVGDLRHGQDHTAEDDERTPINDCGTSP